MTRPQFPNTVATNANKYLENKDKIKNLLNNFKSIILGKISYKLSFLGIRFQKSYSFINI
ncbi:hypothetical protein A7N09_17760 [Acinetobacter baumannii]|nr:hypothetical protein A7N09_17760 [Acinetobacter baumannii]